MYLYQLSYEREEQERRELQKMIHEGASKRKKEEVKIQEQSIPNGVRIFFIPLKRASKWTLVLIDTIKCNVW